MIALLTWTRRVAAAVALATVATLAAPGPAVAHTALVGSSPADGETVVALERVSLTFTERLLEIGHELALVAPDGGRTELVVDEPVTETISAPVPADAAGRGPVVLAWRVVAGDGHPIEGEIAFTYAPATTPPSPTGTAGTSTPSPTASAAMSPAPPSTASPAPTASSAPADPPASLEGGWEWLVVGLAGAAVAATAIVLAARRRPEA